MHKEIFSINNTIKGKEPSYQKQPIIIIIGLQNTKKTKEFLNVTQVILIRSPTSKLVLTPFVL